MDLQAAFTDLPARDWDDGGDGTLRVAVVGLGGFARGVAIPAIDASDYCAFTVGVSGTEATRREVADEHGVTTIDYEAYAEGVASDEYDAAYVATPNRRHLPHAATAADLGKAALVEKPLEATPDRAAAVVDACREAGVTLMTAYRMQTDPVMRRVREFLDADGVGDVLKLAGDFTYPALDAKEPDHWRFDPRLAGGGALFDVGVYPVNTARFLLDADPVSVDGYTRGHGSVTDVDAHVDFHVDFAGPVGSFTASFTGRAHTSLSVLGTDGRVQVTSAFEPRADRRLTVERGDATLTVEGAGADETVEQFDYFARCVLDGERPEPDGEDGLADVRLMEAVYEAAERGERVVVDAG
jgi:xylose dehydrogenase (NAD/NADP)